MNNLHDVLEICLQEIENGADIDTVLFRHPEHAEELRPILEASAQAKMLAVPDPSADVLRRNRAKLLQQAAQMREAKAVPARRFWSVPLRRALVSLAVIVVLFMGTNRLVHASSGTLPGDNLYPVKRTWEDLRVLLTFNTQEREALEVEHENERLNELNELLAKGRAAEVEFAGVVTSQNGNQWVVSTVPVLIPGNMDPAVKVGDAVRIKGDTQSDGTVLARRVELLPAGIPLPSVEAEHASETEEAAPEKQDQSGNENSDDNSGSQTPKIEKTSEPEQESSRDRSSLMGVIDSINGSVLIVNGQFMNISGAEIEGTPSVGAVAKVEGYFDDNGVFIVTRVKFESSGSSGGDSSGTESSDKNGNDDNGGGDDGGDDNGGSNSGSGGGGGDD